MIDLTANNSGPGGIGHALIGYVARRVANGFATNPPAGAQTCYLCPTGINIANINEIGTYTPQQLKNSLPTTRDPQFIAIQRNKVYTFRSSTGERGSIYNLFAPNASGGAQSYVSFIAINVRD